MTCPRLPSSEGVGSGCEPRPSDPAAYTPFFVTELFKLLLSYNSHTIQLTHFKC